jgi:hypothetical protein
MKFRNVFMDSYSLTLFLTQWEYLLYYPKFSVYLLVVIFLLLLLQRLGASTDNAFLQSTSSGNADAQRKNISISKTQGLVDPHNHGTNNQGPSNQL